MTKKDNQNEVVVTSKTTTKQFRFSENQSVYNHPSAERKYTWKVAGQTLYVNEEEFKYLHQLYHLDELQAKSKRSRCQVYGKDKKYNFEPQEKRKMFYKKTVKKSQKRFVITIELVISILSLLVEIISLMVSILK